MEKTALKKPVKFTYFWQFLIKKNFFFKEIKNFIPSQNNPIESLSLKTPFKNPTFPSKTLIGIPQHYPQVNSEINWGFPSFVLRVFC